MIKYLEWDSKFFQLRIGSVVSNRASRDNILEIKAQMRDFGYDLVYLMVDAVDGHTKTWMEEKGIKPVDVKTTFHKIIPDHIQDSPFKIEKYRGNSFTKLLQLALESGHKSRFRLDERLNNRFNAMYKIWIEKSVSGELADILLVSVYNDGINGFVSLKKQKDRGIIGLIAVDGFSRGKGIGSGLLLAAENWCYTEACQDIIVSTQAVNEGACKLYVKNGYRLLSSQTIFHLYKSI